MAERKMWACFNGSSEHLGNSWGVFCEAEGGSRRSEPVMPGPECQWGSSAFSSPGLARLLKHVLFFTRVLGPVAEPSSSLVFTALGKFSKSQVEYFFGSAVLLFLLSLTN